MIDVIPRIKAPHHLVHGTLRTCLLAGSLLLLGIAHAKDNGVLSPASSSTAYPRVSMEAGLLSVAASDVRLDRLLGELARQSGLIIVTREPIAERVTRRFNRLPLPKAVDRILGGHGFILLQPPPSVDAVSRNSASPGRLWVLPTSTQADSALPFSTIDRLRLGLMGSDAVGRRKAVDALAEWGDEETVADLKIALLDRDREVRWRAVAALGHFGGEQAAAALVGAMKADDAALRKETVNALLHIGGSAAIAGIEQALSDSEPTVREAAIKALADLGGEQAVQALAVALGDPDTSLRLEAVDALSGIKGMSATLLLRMALQDEHSLIREAAAESLDERGSEALY